ncbi:hypothetical protein FHU41_002570 [Psychromicrobium silvestre]|uniref:Uncharacterized protein n=1 Tax=Psychromicrobium silvestre TaxID=1645614 RepID=A0A7Y9S8C9_9MICC|nr:hypothetical protein [Psychromicrobium silvestre]NYE96320.1 hypothetical protein [Psychromicrobium silvestre]
MSNTYRGLNRAVLILIGAFLLALGVIVGLTASWPLAAQRWAASAEQLRGTVSEQLAKTAWRLGETELSWIWLAMLAAALTAVVLLLLWIASQGGGRSPVLSKVQTPEGTVTVQEEIATTALKTALSQDPRILHTSVSAWRLGEDIGLKISLQARKGASPRQLADAVEQLVIGLDRLLGTSLPTLISINTGARTGWSHEHRVQ